jgi:hypothetical protein
MRNNLIVLAFAALLVVATGTAVAQETTGGIAGSVSDDLGTPIAGATINVEGAYGTVTAVSDDTGRYRFPRLTPGAYTVTAIVEGYSESSTEVRVILGESVTVDFAMQRSAFEEEIVIYSDTVAIDFTESATASSIREWEIDYLPRGRDFTDVVAFSAGANVNIQGGGVMIDGASGLENRWVIDGIDTTDPEIGNSSVPMRAEFMEEVQVKSAGYMAEYGGSTGGVINAVTRSGRNMWHGGVLVDYEDMSWNGSRREELEYAPCPRCAGETGTESIAYPKDDETRWDPGIFLGGPIVRDYLWFFGSYQPGIRNRKRTVEWVTEPTDTYEQDFNVDYASLNLTANIASALLIKVGANISPYETDGLLPNVSGKSDLAGQENYAPLGQKGERETYSGTIDWIATDNFVVSGRGGFYHTNTEDTGIPFFEIIHNYHATSEFDPDWDLPPQSDNEPGWLSDNLQTGVDAFNTYERTAGSLDASWYITAAGDHALKAGYQTEQITNDVQTSYNADRILYYWGRAYTTTESESVRGEYGYFRLLNIGTFGSVETTNSALFLQDAWSVLPNLTLNLGVRTEAEEVPNFGAVGPQPAIEFDYGDKIAPRLGFAWDMFGDSQWKLYGSYGIYYDVVKYYMPRGLFGADKWVDYFYTLDDPDPYLNDASTCRVGSNTIFERPVCPGGDFIEPVDRRFNAVDPEYADIAQVDPNLKPTEMWEAQLGVDWQFTPKIQLGARYVHKEITRAIEDAGVLVPGIGEVYFISNPGEGVTVSDDLTLPFPKPVRDYDALEITMDRRFADNWSLRGYYRLSRLYGNYGGLANSDEINGFGDPNVSAGDPTNPLTSTQGGRLGPNASRLFDVASSMYDENGDLVYGRLATDRTHQLGVQFLYSFDFGLSVGVNQYIGSGTLISTIGRIPINSYFYPYGRGDLGETSWLTQTDLTLWQTFNFGRFDLSLGLTVLNLFDEDTATRVYTRRQLQDIEVSDEDFLTGFDYAEKLADLGEEGLDTAFNRPDTFQELRRLRLTVKFEF